MISSDSLHFQMFQVWFTLCTSDSGLIDFIFKRFRIYFQWFMFDSLHIQVIHVGFAPYSSDSGLIRFIFKCCRSEALHIHLFQVRITWYSSSSGLIHLEFSTFTGMTWCSSRLGLIHFIFKWFMLESLYVRFSDLISSISKWLMFDFWSKFKAFRSHSLYIQVFQIWLAPYPRDSCPIHFIFKCFRWESLHVIHVWFTS